MDIDISELKLSIHQFQQSRRHVRQRYPSEIRKSVKDLLFGGYEINSLSKELGISYDALQNWTGKKAIKRRTFQEVRIKPVLRESVDVTFQKGNVFVGIKIHEDQYLFLKRLIDAF